MNALEQVVRAKFVVVTLEVPEAAAALRDIGDCWQLDI
jgi:hypothetical protein